MPSSAPQHGPDRRRGQELEPLGHRYVRPRRFNIPHPLVVLAGLAGVCGLYFLLPREDLNPLLRVGVGVAFVVVFGYLSRRSARREAIKRERALEKLREEPIWHLDEE